MLFKFFDHFLIFFFTILVLGMGLRKKLDWELGFAKNGSCENGIYNAPSGTLFIVRTEQTL